MLQYLMTIIQQFRGEKKPLLKSTYLFDKSKPYLVESQNLIYRDVDENFSICSTNEIQSVNMNQGKKQIMKLDFIMYFPILCFFFNVLAFASCEYEIQQNNKNQQILDENYLSFVTKSLFSFQLFAILSIFFNMLTQFSISLLVKQKFVAPEYYFMYKLFKINICIGIVNILSQLLLALVPSQISQIKMNQIQSEENLAFIIFVVSAFTYNLLNFYLINKQTRKFDYNLAVFVTLKTILIFLQGLVCLSYALVLFLQANHQLFEQKPLSENCLNQISTFFQIANLIMIQVSFQCKLVLLSYSMDLKYLSLNIKLKQDFDSIINSTDSQ